MFTVDSIRARTRREPFQPFRITTTAGKTYDITHPDMAAAAGRSVMIPVTKPNGRPADLFTEVALVRIIDLEDLPESTSVSSEEEE